MTAAALLQSSVNELPLVKRGKVRDVYEVDDKHLLIVATDRISAFDCILPTAIPCKGEVLTALSQFWFEMLQHVVTNHLVTDNPSVLPGHVVAAGLDKRSMLVRKTEVFPVE